MIEIRAGRTEDFAKLMDHVVQSFREKNPSHPRFDRLAPDALDASPEKMSWWRLAFVDGEMAAGIEIIPQHIRVDDDEIYSGGIGNVHCWQPYRGSGCMSLLLKQCITDMKTAGMAVSLLGGDRSRYGHYGWEFSGSERVLALSAGIRRHDALPEPPSASDFREFTGDETDAMRMFEAYCRKRSGVIRKNLASFLETMHRPGLVTYINDRPEQFAYVTVQGWDCIVEYAGAADGVERILRFLVKVHSWNVTVPVAELSGETEQRFLLYAANYHMGVIGMTRVNDMAQTLTSYRHCLLRRLKGWNGEFTLAATDGEAVKVTSRDGEVIVDTGDAARADLILSRRDLALLFFGPFTPAAACRIGEAPWRRLVFPLPLHWGTLDHI